MAVAEGTSCHSQAVTEVRCGHTQSCCLRWHWLIILTSPSPSVLVLAKPCSTSSSKFVFYEIWLNKVLGVILLSLATLELQACYLGPALVPLVFNHSVIQWVFLPTRLKHLPQRPAWGSFWSSSHFLSEYWQLGSDSGSLDTSAKHHAKMDSLLHKDKLDLWVCRTCFWVKRSSPTLIYI